jgi:hypothetical protein
MKRVRDIFRAWARATKERVLHLRECAEYDIIIESNYFQNAQKGECFKIIQKAFALVRECRFRTLLRGCEMSF